MLFLIFYLLAFSVGLTWGLVWIMQRGDKKYRLGANYGPVFLWATFMFIFSYLGNIVVSFVFPRAFLPVQFGLLAALLGYGWYKENGYREQTRFEEQKMLEEIDRLEQGLAVDPSNSYYHERLSELYERKGDQAQAERHAEAACGLEPTERNNWRLKTLRQGKEGTER